MSEPNLHPLIRAALQIRSRAVGRHRARQRRRQRALRDPAARAEWDAAQNEQNILFGFVDALDDECALLDQEALDQEHGDPDEGRTS